MDDVIPVAWIGTTEYYRSDMDYLLIVQKSDPDVVKWTEYGLGIITTSN